MDSKPIYDDADNPYKDLQNTKGHDDSTDDDDCDTEK